MKALLLTEYKKLEMTTFPEPEFGAEEVLVRVKACGICGSDVHGYDGSTGRRIPPLVMGHEASGEVAAVGANVKQFRVGDRVTFDSTVYCGRCHFCRAGQVNLCDNRMVLGVSCGDYRRHGAFAEYVAVPQHIIYKLPDGVRYEHGAMIEALSIAFHAVHRSPMRIGSSVVVVGTGMIGLLTIQAARIHGCGKLIAIDLDDNKLKAAKSMGADDTINAKDPDLQQKILALTEGRGADIALECVGAASPVNTAIGALRKGGSLVLVGNLTPRIDVPLQAIVTRELTLLGTCASCGEYPACLEMLARGKVNVAALISAVAPLEDGVSWFQRLYSHEPGLMKVVLTP